MKFKVGEYVHVCLTQPGISYFIGQITEHKQELYYIKYLKSNVVFNEGNLWTIKFVDNNGQSLGFKKDLVELFYL